MMGSKYHETLVGYGKVMDEVDISRGDMPSEKSMKSIVITFSDKVSFSGR